MDIKFTKYHGTGNDFIILDDREEVFDINDTLLINQMCSRRFGIGADGLILLRKVEGFDFKMVYFNADGNQSSMCGNGGRCIVHFAYKLGVFESRCSFLAIDGAHEAQVLQNNIVKLKMSNVQGISNDGDALILDTGSPHYVLEVKDIDSLNVKAQGASIRYSEKYKKEGINVNFMKCMPEGIQVRTYERGVEDETYSCGTGVTACAIGIHEMDPLTYKSPISIMTMGGALIVYFLKNNEHSYNEIWLEGPAKKTYTGIWQKH